MKMCSLFVSLIGKTNNILPDTCIKKLQHLSCLLTKELYSANIFWILIPREVRIYDIVGSHLKTLHVLAKITKPFNAFVKGIAYCLFFQFLTDHDGYDDFKT